MAPNSVVLPNGKEFILHVDYTDHQARALATLVVSSALSLIAVTSLLLMIITSTKRYIPSKGERPFMKSHVAAYFISLLITDLLQAVGSIMNVRWIRHMSVDFGGYCTAQGVIKQAADVGTAWWTLIIALHTFNVLFLGLHIRRYVMWMALISGWSFIGLILMGGPALLNTAVSGPFIGISGYWCWIADGYPVQRIVMDYMIMFLSSFFSSLIYTSIFLRLRGNIVVSGRRIRFRRVSKSAAWPMHSGQKMVDAHVHMVTVAKHMLLYPFSYSILIIPIAACRFAEWSGYEVPFAAVIFSDGIFLLSGFVNTILFVTTRPVLPPRAFTFFRSFTRRRVAIDLCEALEDGNQTIDESVTVHPRRHIPPAILVASPTDAQTKLVIATERTPSPALSFELPLPPYTPRALTQHHGGMLDDSNIHFVESPPSPAFRDGNTISRPLPAIPSSHAPEVERRRDRPAQ